MRQGRKKTNKQFGVRQILFDVANMWNLKYDADDLICETETDSRTWKIDLLPKGKGVGEGWIGSLELVVSLLFSL